ncbi:MerR family transcriptional regulator [Streptomyces sp. NBC_00893]|uniref:MerR family transcriptional regulator n=1 Tax=Streptomyces sp. NBC_00893 TaxID=2975862 RepID=UPI002251D05E|nr:MerR family transcriptional regulator [Streptomyces sp. NBC_00893]MCX4849098.1 MerR family transcriptional regulator [Streptomyces sp. NBC_00893]
MRIGELSSRSGVPVPTIKFYVREGLLPAGRLTSPNQASYDSGHERRLRLIRALLDVGGLPLAAIGDVLRVVEDPEQPVHKVLGIAAKRLTPPRGGESGPELEDARDEVAELLERRGWRAGADGPAGESLAEVIVALRRAGHGGFVELLDDYAAAAEAVARADLDYVGRRVAREDLVESVVVGTVLGEAMFGALRRLAQTDASARAYDGDGATGGSTGPGDGSGKSDAGGKGGASGEGGKGGADGASGASGEAVEVPGGGG